MENLIVVMQYAVVVKQMQEFVWHKTKSKNGFCVN